MRPGYETGNNPFYMKFPREQYYKDHQYVIKYIDFHNDNLFKLNVFLVLKDNIHHCHCILYKK